MDGRTLLYGPSDDELMCPYCGRVDCICDDRLDHEDEE